MIYLSHLMLTILVYVSLPCLSLHSVSYIFSLNSIYTSPWVELYFPLQWTQSLQTLQNLRASKLGTGPFQIPESRFQDLNSDIPRT